MIEVEPALAFEAFGARIGVQSPREIASRIKPRLPPRAEPTAPERLDVVYRIEPSGDAEQRDLERFSLSCDAAETDFTGTLEAVCRELESDMHFHVAVSARGYLFVHAGVVEWGGRALAIPGRTFAGKSSLVLALVAAGGRYFSDEYAVFDDQGMVHSYMKPLSQRRVDQEPLLHPPESLGSPSEQTPVPLGKTIVTRFREGSVWDPRVLTAAEVMMALFDNTVAAQAHPDYALAVLAQAIQGSDGLAGDRGEAADVVAALLDQRRPPHE